MRKVIKVQF